ncbi:unnamed protein product [Schistosoma margrebowiei]|uniref:G_PROTEIN_RECEP_F1_2 domain-containing protein n=1 Tax=Schistosoma margrebowiei TaxID=48269 RepID=A0AA85AMY8_9TREM|nr:unnamed protein product [Schistosoma margrebowiei]
MTSFSSYFVCDYIKHSIIQKSFIESILLSTIGFIHNQSNNIESLSSTDYLLERYTNMTTNNLSSSSLSSYIYSTNNQNDPLNVFNNNAPLNTLLIPVQYDTMYNNNNNNVSLSVIMMICQTIELIWNYIPPLIFFIGTIGNLFSFLVFYKRTTLYPSTHIYLLFLAIVDEGVLCIGLLRRWLDKLLFIRIEDKHWLLCKSIQFIGVTTSYISVWIIVLITVERTIVVISPINSICINRIKRSYISIIILCILSSIICIHFFITVNLVTTNSSYYDQNITNFPLATNEYYLKLNNNNSSHDSNDNLICDFYFIFKQNGFQSIWIWIDATLYSYLPFIIILISNIIILIHIRWATKQRAHLIGKYSSTKFLYHHYTTDNNNPIHHQNNKKLRNLSMKINQYVHSKNQSSSLSSSSLDNRKNLTLHLQMITPYSPSTDSLNSCHSDDLHHHHHNNNDNIDIFHTTNHTLIDRNLCKCKHPSVNMQLKPYNNHNNNHLKGITNKPIHLITRSSHLYSNEMRQLTILLMLISCVFLITTAPVVLIKLLLTWKQQFLIHNMILLELFDNIAEVLMYINHAINFYLYCAVGSRFRKEFKKIFDCELKKRKY